MNTNYLDVIRGMMAAARIKQDKQLLRFTSGFIGDLERAYGKTCTDEQVATLAKALLKAIFATMDKATQEGTEYVPERAYVEFLEGFIPQQLSDVEIIEFFSYQLQELPSRTKGDLMKLLKQFYPNMYDGKVAAKIAGDMFAPVSK